MADKIFKYLEDYQDLWWDLEDTELPIHDCCGKDGIVGDDDVTKETGDYCGYDMTGEQSVLQMSDLGDCSHFPGFWIGTDDDWEDNLDECPIHIFDFEKDDGIAEYVGNFKTYMSTLLKPYIINNDEAKKAYDELKQFSDNVNYKGVYAFKVIR